MCYPAIHLKKKILHCFGNKTPKSIIVGGSYSCAEGNIYYEDDCEYWLSDLDLLCVHDDGFESHETQSIYKKMLSLSNTVNQSNPYFHIGLKLRSPTQLKNEIKSPYFKELSENSFSLYGEDFLDYFDNNQEFGWITDKEKSVVEMLYHCGLTRFWCNVLFFPLRIIHSESKPFRIWYNYFFSRGALDWIAWSLIQQNKWENGYENRFKIWSELDASETYRNQLTMCLDTKLGRANVDFRSIISDILNFSIEEFKHICQIQRCEHDPEFEFLVSMNRFIEGECLKKEKEFMSHHISFALENLQMLLQREILHSEKMHNIELWTKLRSVYSHFRFERNKQDKIDHEIYTKYFLDIGNIN